MPEMDFAADVPRIRSAVAGLPEVIETTCHGTPSWKVGKKILARLREPGAVALPCGTEADKYLLIEAEPAIYFTIPHFDGYAYVLARMDAIGDAELAHRLKLAWQAQATPKIRKLLGQKVSD